MSTERSGGARVIVVGGGWSGLAAAWNLHRAGARPLLIDDRPTLGGRSATAHLGTRAITLGGKNIGRKYSRFRAFAAELGAGEAAYEHFGINSSRIENGRMRTTDSTNKAAALYGMLRGVPPRDLSRILRLAYYVRRDRANAFLSGPDIERYAARTGDPTLSAFFGTRLRERLLRPAVIRMNGAEPEESHLSTLGTNLGMLLDGFDQLTDGFDPLLHAFAAQVETRAATRVTALRVTAGRVTGVRALAPDGTSSEEEADAVVLAVPAPHAAELLRQHHDELAQHLSRVRYFPVSVVVAEYDRPVFDTRIRALTFPADSPLSNAGAYGVTDRHLVRYTFSGRAARALPGDDEELAALAERHLGAHLDLDAPKRLDTATARWQHGLCAYAPAHTRTLSAVDTLTAALPGLTLTGDYARGASIEACVRAAEERTDRLLHHLDRPG